MQHRSATGHGTEQTDGVWGPDTRDAVAAFQEEHELEVTGQLEAETYAALLAEYETAMQAQARAPDQDPHAPIRAKRPLES